MMVKYWNTSYLQSHWIQWKIRRWWDFNYTYIWSTAAQGPVKLLDPSTWMEKSSESCHRHEKQTLSSREQQPGDSEPEKPSPSALLTCRRRERFDYRPHDWRAEQLHLAICKITSGLCALICTFKPGCCYGSLILIQSISLTSFFQPSSCWGPEARHFQGEASHKGQRDSWYTFLWDV